jgi:DNA-binding transcriptional MerR regulator
VVLDKAPDAFRTISEVATDLEVPQHVLRFWESRFREIKPMKRGGGRRYYRPDDVSLLRGIRHLLYGEGYTIRGVQRILKEQGIKFVQAVWQPGAPQPAHRPADDADFVADDAEVRLPTLAEGDRGRGLFGLLPKLLADEGPPPEVKIPPLRREQRLSPAAERMVPPVPVPPGAISRENLRKLQATLEELSECRRLLDVALGGTA